MESRITAWMSRCNPEIEALKANVSIGVGGDVDILVGGNSLRVIIPDFLVLGVSLEDEDLEGHISDLNEKLCNQEKDLDLEEVLEILFSIFIKRHKKPADEADAGSIDEQQYDDPKIIGVEEEDDDYNLRFTDHDDDEKDDGVDASPYSTAPCSLHSLAQDASKACDKAKTQILECDERSILSWCNVVCISGEMIKLKLEIDAWIAETLELRLEAPVEIFLEFLSWKADDVVEAGYFQPSKISVYQQEENDRGLVKKWKHKKSTYALEQLIPGLVRIYLDFCMSKNDVSNINSSMYSNLQKARQKFHNPILELGYFVLLELKNLEAWCPFCYSELPSTTYKVQACVKDFCQYTTQETGLGARVHLALIRNPAVVQLEITFMAWAASTTDRDVFEPFPTFMLKTVEKRARSGWFSDAKATSMGNKMITLISDVIKTIPKVSQLITCENEEELEELLSVSSHRKLEVYSNIENQNRLCYRLLCFCLATDRMTLKLLEGDEELPIRIPNLLAQFAVLYETPEKEADLFKLPCDGKDLESFYAFHGSAACNWFSILRNGIRSLSGTKYMSTGAMYGKGIYCSSYMSKAAQYSIHSKSTSPGYGDRFSDTGLACMAIVEVFLPHKNKNKMSHVFVVPQKSEGLVSLRYLLIGKSFGEHWIKCRDLDDKTDLAQHHHRLRSSFVNQSRSNKF